MTCWLSDKKQPGDEKNHIRTKNHREYSSQYKSVCTTFVGHKGVYGGHAFSVDDTCPKAPEVKFPIGEEQTIFKKNT